MNRLLAVLALSATALATPAPLVTQVSRPQRKIRSVAANRHLTHGAIAPRVSQEFEFDTNGIAFPDGATYRGVQMGNGGAAGEWRVEFHGNLTTLTHLNQDPPAQSLTFAADTAKLFPAYVPGADHAVLDILEGPTGSPAFGTFLVIPEHSEETWQKYGVNTLRKREMEHSGGLMAKSGTGTKTNCCTCWYARFCISVSMVWVLSHRLSVGVPACCVQRHGRLPSMRELGRNLRGHVHGRLHWHDVPVVHR